LRATGTPLTDPRNSVTTPRVDAFAAVSFDPSHFFAAAADRIARSDPGRDRLRFLIGHGVRESDPFPT
jgi:hypothetical protein